ncbi:hypothetical protein MK489_08820 [Myxococcota bacterium]|nr:hypothetical protein [Myxococcota bacterium]
MSEPSASGGGAAWVHPGSFGIALFGAWLGLSVWMADGGLPADDEGALLTNAVRILNGDVYYRDLDAYPLPGATYLLAAAMAGAGPSVEVARVLAMVASTALVLSLYLLALGVLGPRRAAVFGGCLLCFKFLAWPAFTAYMYGDIALSLASAAVLLLMGGTPTRLGQPTTARWFAAGLCVGAATTAKQNLGLYVALALGVVSLWKLTEPEGGRWRRFRAFVLGVGVPLGFGAAYFASQGVLGNLLHSSLIRPFTDYLPNSGVSFLEPLRFWRWGSLGGDSAIHYFSGPFLLVMGRWGARLGEFAPWGMGVAEAFTRFVYASIPTILGLAVWRGFREWRTGAWCVSSMRSVALALVSAAGVASAFPRADFYHVIGVYPWVVLVGFDLCRGAGLGRQRWLLRVAVASIAALVLGSAIVSWAHQRAFSVELELPRASLRVSPASSWVESVVRFVETEVPPGRPLFVYGHEATFYFLADRYSPWAFAQLYPGQEGARQGGELAELLDRDPPEWVIRGQAGDPPLPEYTRELALWVRRNYIPTPAPFEAFPPVAGRPPPAWQAQVFTRRSPVVQ